MLEFARVRVVECKMRSKETLLKWASEPCIMGIDEAGRGPVLDSKTLKEEKGEELFESLKDNESIGWEVDIIDPRELSAKMFKKNKINLNEISHDSASGLVVKVLNPGVLLTKDAQSAINDLTGKWLGNRQIRCNWATKGVVLNDDKQSTYAKIVVELTNGSLEDGKETTNSDASENNPQYTTVYDGNLAPKLDLHRHFHVLGAGVIKEVRVQLDKDFGFMRFSTHVKAALAIQMGNTQSLIRGRQIKCSWGSKPTPPGIV